jgi:hypothetical protein
MIFSKNRITKAFNTAIKIEDARTMIYLLSLRYFQLLQRGSFTVRAGLYC